MKAEIIENISHFTKIPEERIEKYLEENSFKKMLEYPATITESIEEFQKLTQLIKLEKFYARLTRYKDYKFENTLEMGKFFETHYYQKFEKEFFTVAFLDKENNLLGVNTINSGLLDQAVVNINDVLKKALVYGSEKIVISHNHPSGNPEPSPQDKMLTERITKNAKKLDIEVLDHIIVGDKSFFSIKENKAINYDEDIEYRAEVKDGEAYRKDIKELARLLGDFTGIDSEKIEKAFMENSVEDFFQRPEKYIKDREDAERIRLIDEFFKEYNKECVNSKTYAINDSVKLRNFVEMKYPKYSESENMDIAIFVSTKLSYLSSLEIPQDLEKEEKIKLILRRGLINDSNNMFLVSKISEKDDENEKIKELTEIEVATKDMVKLLDYLQIKGDGRVISFAKEREKRNTRTQGQAKEKSLFKGTTEEKTEKTTVEERRKKYFTREEITQASNFSIIDYLDRTGIRYKQERSNYFLEEHDSCKIDLSGLKFNWFSREKGGGLIQFVEAYHQISWYESLVEISEKFQEMERTNEAPRKIILEKTPPTKKELKLPERAGNNNKVIDYLHKKRGISRKVIKNLIDQGRLYQDVRNNCVFVGYSNDEPKYAFIRGTNDSSRFLGEARGSDKTIGFRKENKLSSYLYVFEGAIDMISFMELKPFIKNENLLSMGGLNMDTLSRFLQENKNIKEINIALDNDEKGKMFTEKIFNELDNKYSLTKLSPKGKDWNEDLVKLRERERERERVEESFAEDFLGMEM